MFFVNASVIILQVIGKCKRKIEKKSIFLFVLFFRSQNHTIYRVSEGGEAVFVLSVEVAFLVGAVMKGISDVFTVPAAGRSGFEGIIEKPSVVGLEHDAAARRKELLIARKKTVGCKPAVCMAVLRPRV